MAGNLRNIAISDELKICLTEAWGLCSKNVCFWIRK